MYFEFTVREQLQYNNGSQEVVTSIHLIKIKTHFCQTPSIQVQVNNLFFYGKLVGGKFS